MKKDKNENKALSQTSVMVSADYKGYTFEEDITGYAPKHLRFHFFAIDDECAKGAGESIEDCKQQIDELILNITVMENECLHKFNSVYYGSEWVVECEKCHKEVYDLYSVEDGTEIINNLLNNK
jgi:hypothetical protein